MKLIYKLFYLFIFAACLGLYYTSSFAFGSPFSSSFFLDSPELYQQIKSNGSLKLTNDINYSGYQYKVISALGILGYKTFNRSPLSIVQEFRIDNKLNNYKNNELNPKELDLIDILLTEQEKIDKSAINYYSNKYDHISYNIDHNNLEHIHALAQLYRYMEYLPSAHLYLLKQVTFNNSRNGANGYSGEGEIILRIGYFIDDYKLRNVFFHEMGHIVDRGYTGNSVTGNSSYVDMGIIIYNDDPSILFYNISYNHWFEPSKVVNANESVSEYALKNPYEDFAETYTMYVTNANTLRCMAQNSSIIASKFNVLKSIFFSNIEFYTGENTCPIRMIADATNLY